MSSTLECVSNHRKSAGLTSTYFAVASTENGILPIDSTLEKDDIIREENSILQEIEEMNRFEEKPLDDEEVVDYSTENNI